MVCCLRLIKMFVGNKPLVITNCRKSIYHLCVNFYYQIPNNFIPMERDYSYFWHVLLRTKIYLNVGCNISNQAFLWVSNEVALRYRLSQQIYKFSFFTPLLLYNTKPHSNESVNGCGKDMQMRSIWWNEGAKDLTDNNNTRW